MSQPVQLLEPTLARGPVVIGWLPLALLLIVGTAIGLAWSLFGPAKKPKLQA